MKQYKLSDKIDERLFRVDLELYSDDRKHHFRISHENGFFRYIVLNNSLSIVSDFFFKGSSNLPFGGMLMYEGEAIDFDN